MPKIRLWSWLRNAQWGCQQRCFSVHLQCRIGGRAGDAMRLASSTTSISSSSTISTLLLSFTTISLLLVVAEAGTHLDEPWFRWRGGNVNYYFKVVAKSISVKSTFSVFPKIISSSWFPMFWTSKMQMVIFQDMTNADRRVMRNMMRMIEQRTCLRFREQRGPLVGLWWWYYHHLFSSCFDGLLGRGGGGVLWLPHEAKLMWGNQTEERFSGGPH